MIIENTKKQVQTSGNIQSASCTIDSEDMRYIASLLRNNYSDTILATMREIVANAIDVSGDRKPEVSLPTRLEPNFIVRDYGVGLSEEDMLGLYTKYGKSTKRDTNNAIGGFGIGRFAPLSYTESFIIVSVNDNVKSTYTIRVDENDDTVVSKMSSESTNEDNGIYVQVPIKSKDIDDFFKTFNLFSYYVQKSVKIVNHKFEYLEPDFSNDVFDGYIGEARNYWNKSERLDISNSPYVLMGDILYPVRKSSKYTKFVDGLVYKAEIGEFKLHHSREALEYNDKTVEALSVASDKIRKSFVASGEKMMIKCNTLYEATEFHHTVFQSIQKNLFKQSTISLTWRGKQLSSEVFGFGSDLEMKLISKTENGNMSMRETNQSYRYHGEPHKDRFFVIDDNPSPRSPLNRLSWINGDQTVVFITKPTNQVLDRVKDMNHKNVRLLSEYPRILAEKVTGSNRAKRGSLTKKDILQFKMDKTWIWKQSSYWKEVEEKFEDDKTYYYYVYYANKVKHSNNTFSEPCNIQTKIQELQKIKPEMDNVYGVKAKALKKIEKLSNWICVDDVEQKVIEGDPLLSKVKRKDLLDQLLEPFGSRIQDALEIVEPTEVILNLKKLIDENNSIEIKSRPKLPMGNIKIDMASEEKITDAFYAKYPLTKHLQRGYYNEGFTEDFANYLANW